MTTFAEHFAVPRQRVRRDAPLVAWTPGPLDSPCLLFLSARPDGYGSAWADGRRWRAHVLAWTLANGPVPDGLHVLHRCDVPACVNPAHLFLGTHADNMADREAKGRTRNGNSGKPECVRGHPFAPENTYVNPNGERYCRACERLKHARRRAKVG